MRLQTFTDFSVMYTKWKTVGSINFLTLVKSHNVSYIVSWWRFVKRVTVQFWNQYSRKRTAYANWLRWVEPLGRLKKRIRTNGTTGISIHCILYYWYLYFTNYNRPLKYLVTSHRIQYTTLHSTSPTLQHRCPVLHSSLHRDPSLARPAASLSYEPFSLFY